MVPRVLVETSRLLIAPLEGVAVMRLVRVIGRGAAGLGAAARLVATRGGGVDAAGAGAGARIGAAR